MSGDADAERRKYDRAPVEVPVDYSGVDTFFSEFTANINEGGLFIKTEKPLEQGTEVDLKITIPGDNDPIHVQGRVVWINLQAGPDQPQGMGIEFETLDPSVQETVNRLVRELRVSPTS